ncbi:expressed unknown protein [Seminavis robusta]|uniref:Uncharacterized protein n=1 Tax=Seminavis robusta TaxID=568900 RepID=A0A9N8DAD8_9STRA|nr:expressed unknown protein [Seminavis robusta]|eukprot:Sro64_g036150.1 n/a (421) ;mRNA; r:24843-26105
MGLYVDTSNTTTTTNQPRRSMMNQSTGKTLNNDQGPSRRLSLLVDYSTQKAKLGNTKPSLFPSKSFHGGNRRRRDVLDTIDSALHQSTSSMNSSSSDSNSLEESFALNDDTSLPVRFRVRRSSMERCTSFDERKLSSYDHLQNSLSAMIMAEVDDDENNNSSSSNNNHDEESEEPQQQRQEEAPLQRANRRMMLLKSRGGKNKSMMNLNGSNHASTGRPGLAHIMRKTKSVKDLFADATTCGAVGGGRRSQLGSSRCTSCRHLVRRSKSMNDSKTDFSLQLLEESFHNSLSSSKSFHNNTSTHSTSGSSPKPKRPSPRGRPLYGKAMSCRDLLMDDESMMSASVSDHQHLPIPKRSVIRKLDKNSGHGAMTSSTLQRFMNSTADFGMDASTIRNNNNVMDPMAIHGGRSFSRRLAMDSKM